MNPPPAKPSVSKRFLYGGVLALVVLLTIEAITALGISVVNPRLDAPIHRTSAMFRQQSAQIQELLRSHTEGGRTVFDPHLGYRYRAGWSAENDVISRQGLRSSRLYSPTPDSGVLRVAAFGNSFTYCVEVASQHAWPALIEHMFPAIEVLNYGVGAYGTDQAYLRYRHEGLDLDPAIVVLGFAPVMMNRTVSVYRRFLSMGDSPVVKPRFVLDADTLALIPPPLRSVDDYHRFLEEPDAVTVLGENDHWYRPGIYENPFYDRSAIVRLITGLWVRFDNRYLNPNRTIRRGVFNTEAEAYRLQRALLMRFADDVRTAGQIPLVVMFPSHSDLESVFSTTPPVYQPLLDELREMGIETVDLREAFKRHGPPATVDEWFMPLGHYSASANSIAAIWIGERLRDLSESAHDRYDPSVVAVGK